MKYSHEFFVTKNPTPLFIAISAIKVLLVLIRGRSRNGILKPVVSCWVTQFFGLCRCGTVLGHLVHIPVWSQGFRWGACLPLVLVLSEKEGSLTPDIGTERSWHHELQYPPARLGSFSENGTNVKKEASLPFCSRFIFPCSVLSLLYCPSSVLITSEWIPAQGEHCERYDAFEMIIIYHSLLACCYALTGIVQLCCRNHLKAECEILDTGKAGLCKQRASYCLWRILKTWILHDPYWREDDTTQFKKGIIIWVAWAMDCGVMVGKDWNPVWAVLCELKEF